MLNMYSIHDKKSDTYSIPAFSLTDGTIIRDFRVYLQNKTMYSDYPEDYDLYEIGSFEESTGLVYNCDPRFVISFLEILKMNESEVSDEQTIPEDERES